MGAMNGQQRSVVKAGRWQRLSPLERVGVVALGVVVGGVAFVVVAPQLTAATVGGALTSAGVWLVRRAYDA